MKIVIFGLTISSSWGNGHATLWRGLCSALHRMGHTTVFFERDVPYYAGHRDLLALPGGELVLYSSWPDVIAEARRHLADADVAIVTSYCPDGIAAADLMFDSQVALRSFYDMDTGITLARLDAGEQVAYLPPEGLTGFDLVLSYTGGRALDDLRTRLGARLVAPLYGHVDPEGHKPAAPMREFACDLSYLGTYAEDRQRALETLLIEAARREPGMRFLIGGSMYPQDFPWSDNIYFVRHIPPYMHAAFYSSCRLTLNVTRQPMAAMGYCPSGRLFEAAACSVAIISDWWEGLDEFYKPGEEIIVASNTEEVIAALHLSADELGAIARRARERTLSSHTAAHRAQELIGLLERTKQSQIGGKEVCGESYPQQGREAAYNR